MADDNGPIHRWREGRVLVISMRREAKRNAVDRLMADGLDAALNELDDDPTLWVGVLTGTDTTFCAGSDLNALGDFYTERGGAYGIIRRHRVKPLIAAVEGPAVGGGLEIVLACDLVSASTSARFGLPEVRRGIVPGSALYRGPRGFPLNLAKELLLTGELVDAARAHAVGFVNVLTESGKALEGALLLAERICANSPGAVQAALAALNRTVALHDDVGFEAQAEAFAAVDGSADQREGIEAFLAKRPPRWTVR